MTSPAQLEDSRALISSAVRLLRKSRRWTQEELATKLGLSQNRLSEIERGGGSFTAEQFLLILRLFNADVGDFEPPPASDGPLQNALIRFGADHLRHVPDAPASGRYPTASDAIAAVLLDPYSERFVTALAPVLLRSCDDVALPVLQHALSGAGRADRVGWLAENTKEAVTDLAREGEPGLDWRKRAGRLQVVLSDFLARLRPSEDTATRDALDRGIRTTKSLENTWKRGSAISRKWHIVSAIQVEDFTDALRRARESH